MSDPPEHRAGTPGAPPLAAPDPVERADAEPVGAEPARAEPVGAEPVRAEPVRAEPIGAENAAQPPPAGPRYRELAIGLILLVVLLASEPLWSPLLPWSPESPAIDAAVVARLERLEAAQLQFRQARSDAAAASAAAARLEQRLAALEAKPPPQAPDAADLRQQIERLSAGMRDLSARADRLDQGVQAAQAVPSSDLPGRVETLETALRTQVAAGAELAARIAALDRALASAAAELAARVDAVEKAGQARAAGDTADVGLALALLQIRAAIDTGRPFAAEYEALAALARGRPAISAAAAPLAEPATAGVATRAVLARRLREIAPALGAASAGAPAGDGGEAGWADRALARLRGLVTIRRIDQARPLPGPDSAAQNAERALAGGDLAGAVAALERLEGAAAEQAAPWLRMARERLAVETALQRVEAALTARLGTPAAAPGSSG